MATENPKISAYVPQIVYSRFKQYQEERQLSMSQAVAQLITEYFGIDLTKSIVEQSTSELPSRLELVEQELRDLKQFYLELSEKLNSLQFNDALKGESNSELSGELLSNQASKILDTPFIELPNDLDSGSTSKLQSELPMQLELVGELDQKSNEYISELLSETESELLVQLTPEVLGHRLNVSAKYIGNQKTGLARGKFTEWTTKKDPDNIGWKPIKKGRNTYYIPAHMLSSEVKDKLLIWEKSNSNF